MSFKMLFLLFIMYSILGWAIEVMDTYILNKKWVNRGFLIGPYCPIYGCGGVLMSLLVSNDHDIVSTFLKCMAICSILEYSTSYIMEKMFHTRWWDYSQRRFNLNGRICFEGLTFFGIGGCLCLYIVAPHMQAIFAKMKPRFRVALCVVLSIIFLLDVAYSYNNPNVGAGITDDGSHNQIIEETLKEAN